MGTSVPPGPHGALGDFLGRTTDIGHFGTAGTHAPTSPVLVPRLALPPLLIVPPGLFSSWVRIAFEAPFGAREGFFDGDPNAAPHPPWLSIPLTPKAEDHTLQLTEHQFGKPAPSHLVPLKVSFRGKGKSIATFAETTVPDVGRFLNGLPHRSFTVKGSSLGKAHLDAKDERGQIAATCDIRTFAKRNFDVAFIWLTFLEKDGTDFPSDRPKSDVGTLLDRVTEVFRQCNFAFTSVATLDKTYDNIDFRQPNVMERFATRLFNEWRGKVKADRFVFFVPNIVQIDSNPNVFGLCREVAFMQDRGDGDVLAHEFGHSFGLSHFTTAVPTVKRTIFDFQIDDNLMRPDRKSLTTTQATLFPHQIAKASFCGGKNLFTQVKDHDNEIWDDFP